MFDSETIRKTASRLHRLVDEENCDEHHEVSYAIEYLGRALDAWDTYSNKIELCLPVLRGAHGVISSVREEFGEVPSRLSYVIPEMLELIDQAEGLGFKVRHDPGAVMRSRF